MLRKTLLVLAIASSLVACGKDSKAPEGKDNKPTQLTVAQEDVLTIQSASVSSGPVITGSIEPERRADLRAEVSAIVLQVLKENSLPRESFKNLGEVFGGDGMISSSTEVQARMAYALSQELADTLSRIDGVLTARVHVVLGVNDKVNNITVNPSASVFLRHSPDSPVVNLVPEIRELVAGAVASLKYDDVSVMLVPVRESVTVPETPPAPAPLLSPDTYTTVDLLRALALALAMLAVGGSLALMIRRVRVRRQGKADSPAIAAGEHAGRGGRDEA